ncbi:hypothetical protein, partial [Enterococcus ureilyticus]|uniref:hypothetical protein n=1 Tax=Enterococcus ureilyticus TaxID=1131292 RepID=UPI00196A8ADB
MLNGPSLLFLTRFYGLALTVLVPLQILVMLVVISENYHPVVPQKKLSLLILLHLEIPDRFVVLIVVTHR